MKCEYCGRDTAHITTRFNVTTLKASVLVCGDEVPVCMDDVEFCDHMCFYDMIVEVVRGYVR